MATAGSDATIKSALGAVMEAIRSAYGPTAQRAAELEDGGHDPTFLDRTAPLLEFLWSRYFRVRLLGVENVPATGELSLDSVFRADGARGPRNAQGFSFDQFFSQNADGERTSGGASAQENPASGEPAERTADDIEQFNSWLQGLKQR